MIAPFLADEHAVLRPVEPSDAPLLAACNNDPAVRVSFFTHTPVSVAQQTDRARSFYHPGADYIPFVIHPAGSDKGVGITALHRVDLVSGAAVFSICITEAEARGKGLGGAVTAMMLRYAFNVLNLHRVQLHVWAENTAAVKAYEKAGFVVEGRLREAMKHDGKRCDFLVMSVLEPEWRARHGS